jgi:hypothetical protein
VYSPLDRRGQEYVRADGRMATVPDTWTAPPLAQRSKVLLGRLQLIRHFRAQGLGEGDLQ